MSHFISPEACASNRWQNSKDQPDACRLGGDRRTGFHPPTDEKVGAKAIWVICCGRASAKSPCAAGSFSLIPIKAHLEGYGLIRPDSAGLYIVQLQSDGRSYVARFSKE